MTEKQHIMLDLETMGKGPRAAIVAIGCVRIEQGAITDTYYRRVNLESSLQAGLKVDASTVNWWLNQDAAARAEVDGSQAAVLLADERLLGSITPAELRQLIPDGVTSALAARPW